VCRTLSKTLRYNQPDLWDTLSRQLLVAFDKTNRIDENTRMEESDILMVLRTLMNIANETNVADVFYVLAISSVLVSN